jgi:hypothetical protein
MTARYEGQKILVEGSNFSVPAVLDFCRGTWGAAKAVAQSRALDRPAEGGVPLDGQRTLHPKLSSTWYHAFDEAEIRQGKKKLRVSAKGAPSPRNAYAMAVTGSHAFIWGGLTPDQTRPPAPNDPNTLALGSGAVLDLKSGQWRTSSTKNAPSARFNPIVALKDGRVVIWGGQAHQNKVVAGKVVTGQLLDGGVYDMKADRWTPIPEPTPRLEAGRAQQSPAAVWVGNHLLIAGSGVAILDLSTNTWKPIASPPFHHASQLEAYPLTAPSYLIIEKGGPDTLSLYKLDLAAGLLTPIELPAELKGLSGLNTVWTGKRLFVLGGYKLRDHPCLGARQEGEPGCLPPTPVVEKWNPGWVYVP